MDNGPGARDHEDVVVQTRKDHVLFGVDLVVSGGRYPRGDDVVGWVGGWVHGGVGVGVMARPLEGLVWISMLQPRIVPFAYRHRYRDCL